MLLFAILILIPSLALAQDPIQALENKLFGLLDSDKDGKITEVETETYFLTFDIDKNGQVSKTEFHNAVEKIDPILHGHEDQLFIIFDRDNNGHVDKSDIDASFSLIDINNDGYIDKHEFHLTLLVIETAITA